MKTEIVIKEEKKERDYFPSLFRNKDNSVIILADGRVSAKTFSGMVIHCTNDAKKMTLGTYSTGWTYEQFTRLPKGSEITMNLIQED